MTGIPIKSVRQALSELSHEDLIDYCLSQSVLACCLMDLVSPDSVAASLLTNSRELERGTELSKGIQERVSELEAQKLRRN